MAPPSEIVSLPKEVENSTLVNLALGKSLSHNSLKYRPKSNNQ